MIHQCWDCDSEGEFYAYDEPEVSQYDVVDNDNRNTKKLLH